MKRLSAAALAALSVLALWAAPVPARANVFCPVTIASLTDLALVGKAGTWGVLLDADLGDTRSARVRVDTEKTRYALDITDIPLMTFNSTRVAKYFVLPQDEHVLGAWVQATGLSPVQRLDCPITAPWSPNPPPAATPGEAAARDRDRKQLIDLFGTRTTPVLTPIGFGPASQVGCTQPYAAPKALAPLKPPFPADARSVNATGVVEMRLDIDEAGTLLNATVTRSSGFASFDRAALDTARRAKYAAAVFGCRPIATSLVTTVGFGA